MERSHAEGRCQSYELGNQPSGVISEQMLNAFEKYERRALDFDSPWQAAKEETAHVLAVACALFDGPLMFP